MSLEKEFDKWQSSVGDEACFIWLDGSSKSVTLLLDGNDEFTIKITGSGQYELSSSSKSIVAWTQRVNAAIKSHPPASFVELLSTAASIHKNKNVFNKDEDLDLEDNEEGDEEGQELDEDGDDEEEDEYEGGTERHNIRNEDEYMGEDFDLESENFKEGLEVLRKRKRWAQKEAEIRSLVKEQERKKADLDKGKGRVQSKVEQIFSSTAATGVLTNDLLDIMQRSTELGFVADPIEDNIYHWRVKMFSFDPTSSIGKHLTEIEKAYGYSYVELGVELTMDLYPFYPPIVKVIRPRLKGFMMGRVTSMEILKLSYWDPVKGMKYVLGEIRNMLQEHGKLDVNNPMNDMVQYPAGAYTKLEYLLLRLELLCETEPRANLKYVVPEKLLKQPVKAKKVEENAEAGKFWARGTGYGHGHTGKVDWDVQAYLAAQKQKDKETQSIIEAIITELETPNENVQFEIIEESCLVPVLENYFRNDSLLDMGRHSSLYIVLLGVVKAVAKQQDLLPLVDTLPNQAKSVHLLLADLDAQARVFLKRLTSSGESGTEVTALAETVVQTYAIVEAGVEKMAADIQILTNSMKSTQYDTKSTVDPADWEKNYIRNMKKLQFDIVNIDIKGHHYSNSISKGGAVSKEKVLRLAQEQGSISTSLPLTYSSSVFVRIDEQHMDVMKVLITGPDDTPYSDGCFLFDIYFPTTYPNSPPQVNLQTTGNGSVRFNPNLYNCGKVCLSLLGTWSGAESENWNKDTSTLLQVLVSIQSLILVPLPFYNEPGYESQMGTPKGDANSRQYNEVIRVAAIEHAMVGQLRKPPQHFEQIINNHFWYKRDAINKVCDQWLQDAQHQNSSKGHHAKLLKVVKDLRDEFAKLIPPA